MESPPADGSRPPQSLSPLPPLDNTYGALLVGTFFALMLYGWYILQCSRYIHSYPRDRWELKTLTLGIVDGMTTFLCEMFYLRRVYLINRRLKYFFGFIGALIVVQFAVGLTSTILGLLRPYEHGNKFGVRFMVEFGWRWHCDLGRRKYRRHSRLYFEREPYWLQAEYRTDTMIDWLVAYTINTGLLMGIFTTLSFIFAIVMPQNMIYVGIDLVTIMLYTNSLMTVYVQRPPVLLHRPDPIQAQCTWRLVNASNRKHHRRERH
ncbi:uncharacterized protein BXZ73DRAFT_99233 [Epithele typhae]|uniref:uncharacterized protein n=1 Tax=Epithele typhae TaxID=378194 RepID=UPI002007C560|nr:uncharacterized protein BXZ73DRAFT_99233 [Epithele typhae]KAH9939617.1 hypothetical protein BXZ73DRAFT_99233 [Epithele typhae]